MRTPSGKKIGTLVAVFVLSVPAAALALCENIDNARLTVGFQRWRTLTGSDQAYTNSFYDGGSEEPNLPQYQEIGWLPAGKAWIATFVGTIQDSSDSECDDVTEGLEIDYYSGNNTCAQPADGYFQAVYHVSTCGGPNKFFGQRQPGVYHTYSLSYRIQNFIFRGSTLASSQINGCVRVSAVEGGCN